MHFSLTEQVALITGGNSGIGLCTVKRFLEAGAEVVVADLAAECTLEAQPNLLYRQCDVTQEGQVKAAMEEAVTAFDSLTVVVNNAGIFSNYNAIQDKSADDFLRCHQVNLMGALHAMKHAANIMSGDGSIVNTASAAGLVGVVGLSDYVASKHALVGLSKSAALELASHQIRVNCVCPSSVDTPMANAEGGEDLLAAEKLLVPLGRICTPEEAAALIHFLASPESAFISGQAIMLDGGMSAGTSAAAFDKLAQS